MSSLLYSTVAYGKEYADFWLTGALPALIDPSNASAIGAVHVYTNADTKPQIEAHENWGKITAPKVIHTIPTDLKGGAFGRASDHIMAAAFRRSMARAREMGVGLVFNGADTIFAAGGIPFLLSKLDEGHDAVCGVPLRVSAESVTPIITQVTKALTATEMYWLGRHHLHPLALVNHWESPNFSRIPYCLLWSTPNCILNRSLTIVPLAFLPSEAMLSAPMNSSDAMVDHLFQNPFYVENWPDAANLELMKLNAFNPWFRPGPSIVDEYVTWSFSAAPKGFQNHLKYRFRQYAPEHPPGEDELSGLLAKSNAVVDEILERSGLQDRGEKPAPVVEVPRGTSGGTSEYTQIIEGRHGKFLVNVNDAFVGKSFIEYGEFSKGEGDLFARLVKSGMAVVEVGANIGAHTVQLAKLVGETGSVVAFEPQRHAFQMLCANVALNSLPNVQTFRAAVGEKPGTLKLSELDPRSPNNFGGFDLEEMRVDQGMAVQVVTLDSLDRCDFLKLDCEGMELQVLKGGLSLIKKHRPIIYLENDRAESQEAVIRWLRDLGYDTQWDKPMMFSPDNYFGNPVNHFGHIASINMLAVPCGAVVPAPVAAD